MTDVQKKVALLFIILTSIGLLCFGLVHYHSWHKWLPGRSEYTGHHTESDDIGVGHTEGFESYLRNHYQDYVVSDVILNDDIEKENNLEWMSVSLKKDDKDYIGYWGGNDFYTDAYGEALRSDIYDCLVYPIRLPIDKTSVNIVFDAEGVYEQRNGNPVLPDRFKTFDIVLNPEIANRRKNMTVDRLHNVLITADIQCSDKIDECKKILTNLDSYNHLLKYLRDDNQSFALLFNLYDNLGNCHSVRVFEDNLDGESEGQDSLNIRHLSIQDLDNGSEIHVGINGELID